ncbi:MAG: thiamine pyrophosphate-binding protein, partial [Actinobacteria bacterium]|nr:thiamine pyrophosphate-binding protein [Actinomycetota bacterium]
RQNMVCIPFVHEVSATIACEYFNALRPIGSGKAFVLVTAGPGLTNAVTAIAGAFLESRELLVIGGQVKSTDLSRGQVRQRGIQEIDGCSIVSPISKIALRLELPLVDGELDNVLLETSKDRPGPVFLEICLDTQAANVDSDPLRPLNNHFSTKAKQDLPKATVERAIEILSRCERPILLVGGGFDRSATQTLLDFVERNPLPVMTTWNGADRIPADHPNYAGRPNTWGQRRSNIVLQQADVILALGSRLGLQQTGFNWQEFAPLAKVIQVDIDEAELTKGHPHVDLPIVADAARLLDTISTISLPDFSQWNVFVRSVINSIPLSETANRVAAPFINSYEFVEALSEAADSDDVIVPCSSGGAFTVMMQTFQLKVDQRMLSNKGLASMGYGLAGAIGASIANPTKRTILVEGDGGFSQNLQELATVSRHGLPLKMFLFANNGYASIRMTQKNYFGGEYLGCDTSTGLGFPDWKSLATAFEIEYLELTPELWGSRHLQKSWSSRKPSLYVVPIDPEQTYFPKISSRVTENGSMQSAPLHLMTPDLDPTTSEKVFRYLTY